MRVRKSLIILGLAVLVVFSCGVEKTDKGTGPADSTPPARITDLATVTHTDSSLILTWTAPGDDDTTGTAARYDIRYDLSLLTDSSWDSAYQPFSLPIPQAAGTPETALVLNLEPDTTYYFGIKAADEVPNWSGMSNVVTGATAADTIPPATITDLHVVDSSSTTITLAWTTPGDDDTLGQASFYDIRYSTSTITTVNFVDAQRASFVPVPVAPGIEDSALIVGLASGTLYYFAMKTSDEALNWAAISNIAAGQTVFQSGSDTIPPATITDLYIAIERKSQINFCWTAPGDDGMEGTVTQYDIRYSTTPIKEETFDEAQRTDEEPYAIVAGGELQCDEIKNLDSGQVYHFAIKAADEYDNWSGMSNVAMGFTGDTIPPAAITNLQIRDYSSRWAELSWSAPGDDSVSGRAKNYDIRFSPDPITDLTFDKAVQVDNPPNPAHASTGQSFVVNDLEPLSSYYFAIKTQDEMNNWSGLSNVFTVSTPEGCPPATITDLRVTESTLSSLEVTWTAPGEDSTFGTATTTDLRYSTVMITEDNFTKAFLAQGMPNPLPAGSTQTYTLTGLNPNTGYYLAMASVDEVRNWSGISNIAYGFTRDDADTIAPSPITNLHPETMKSSSVLIKWTAPGDDGPNGQVDHYGIRYAQQPITDESWLSATLVEDAPNPQIVGSLESFTIEGLLPSTSYYIAIRSADTSGNWSALSNVTEVLTSGEPDTWHTVTGGDYNDVAYSVAPAINGGCAVVGEMGLPGESQPPLHPSAGYFIHIDEEGNVVWERKPREAGLPGLSAVRSVIPTLDGGFIALGEFNTWSSPNIIVSNVYLMNFDEYGNFPWINTLLNISDWSQYADVVFPTQDGNVVTIWQYGSNDAILLKADYSGQTIWKKTQSASAFHYCGCYDICHTAEGGYIIAGAKCDYSSQWGDLNTYIFETDPYGRFIRDTTFGGDAEDVARGVVALPDGNYLLAGWTESYGHGSKDVHLIWVDSACTMLDEMFLGAAADDAAFAITQTSDGNFVIAGSTASFGAGSSDIYLIKINSSGVIIWEKTIGGSYSDVAYDVQEAPDGGLFIVGSTSSYGAGNSDFYIIKTDANGEL